MENVHFSGITIGTLRLLNFSSFFTIKSKKNRLLVELTWIVNIFLSVAALQRDLCLKTCQCGCK